MPRWLRRIAVAAVLSFASAAGAQWSGSVALLSDFRFRGVSFSAGDPAAQIDLTYDARSGAYAGAFVSSTRFNGYPEVNRLTLLHAGYAHRIAPDLGVDAGLSYADFSAGNEFDYAEVHVGVTTRAVSMQVAHAPHYFGQGGATYVEVNGGTEIVPSWRLFAHAGLLHARPTYPHRSGTQADGRIGLRFEHERFNAQLSRVAVSRVSPVYPGADSGKRGGWVVQVGWVF